MVKLTEEQRKLVEDNVAIAWKHSKRVRPPYGVTQEDWVSHCCEVLCYAASKWKPDGGRRLDSYFIMIMEDRWRDLNRVVRAKKRIPLGKLKFEIQLAPDDRNELNETPAPSSGQFKYFDDDSSFIVGNLVNSLEPNQREVAELILSGLELKEVGNKLGITYSSVKGLWWRAVRNMREEASKLELEYV